MSIAKAELALIARIKALFGTTLRRVDSIPAEWDDEMIKRLMTEAPAVYVAFAGGLPSKAQGTGAPVLDARFVLVTMTTHVSGEKARRMGDTRMIGAYEIIGTLIGGLHEFTLEEPVGDILETLCTLHFDSCENLFDNAREKDGAALYGVAFRTELAIDSKLGPASLDNFLRYRDQVQLQPVDASADVDAQDAVDLEAAP